MYRASIIYTFFIILSISIFYLVRQPSVDYIEDLLNFILVALSIGAVTWLTAGRMQKWLRESTMLSKQDGRTNQTS